MSRYDEDLSQSLFKSGVACCVVGAIALLIDIILLIAFGFMTVVFTISAVLLFFLGIRNILASNDPDVRALSGPGGVYETQANFVSSDARYKSPTENSMAYEAAMSICLESKEDVGIMRSKKLGIKKILMIVWLIVALAVVVLMMKPTIDYIKYYGAQCQAVEIVLGIHEGLDDDRFDEYKNDSTQLVKAMYKYYNPHYGSYYWSLGIYDEYYDEHDSLLAVSDTTLGSMLEELGYERPLAGYGSYYLKYTNMFEFIFSWESCTILFVISLSIVVLAVIATTFCMINKRSELTIDGNTITGRKVSGKILQFFAKDIKSVETTGLKGLKIKGDGIKYKIILIENADELKARIMTLISEAETRSTNTASYQTDAMDALKKAKELLDTGVITEKEFSEKKKQLLEL